MKKALCIALAVLAAVAVLATAIIPAFAVNAEGTAVSLFPENASDFTTLAGGEGTITVTKEGDAFKFASNKGWPQAFCTLPESKWAVADVDDPNCYLEWDFEVVSGSANVLVYFCGQNPTEQASAGYAETINYYIDHANNTNASNAVVDLPKGHYQGRIHVSETGIAPNLIGEDGTYTISGMKVFAVGGTTVVNKLQVVTDSEGGSGGVIDPTPGDDIVIEETEETLLPPSADNFEKLAGGEGEIAVVGGEDGTYTFSSAKGWPQAWYNAPESAWVKADVNNPDCYLEWDFEVVSGAANVLVFFGGQNPAEQPAAGFAETINYYIDPANNTNASNAVVDLPKGHYQGRIHVSETGVAPELIAEDGTYMISGMKVFAVGGTTIVNKLAVVTTTEGGNTPGGEEENPGRDDPDQEYYGLSYEEWKTYYRADWYDFTNNVLTYFETGYDVYAANERIEAYACIVNFNRDGIEVSSLEIPVPEGYTVMSSQIVSEKTVLAYGEQADAYLTILKNTSDTPDNPDDPDNPDNPTTAAPTTTTTIPYTPDGPKGDSPNTGDTSNAMVALMVVLSAGAVIAVLCTKSKKARSILSLVLVCAMTLTAVGAAIPAIANAEEMQAVDVTIEKPIYVGDEEVTLAAKASYNATEAWGTDWTEEAVSALYHATGKANMELSKALDGKKFHIDVAIDAMNEAIGILADFEEIPSIWDEENATLLEQAEAALALLEELKANGFDVKDLNNDGDDTFYHAYSAVLDVDNGAYYVLLATYYSFAPALRDQDKVLDGAKLVAYGDSLTAFGTWPLSVAKNCNMYVFNGAMGGINTDEALERFDKYVANRDADFVTLCFGMNDLLMNGKNNPQVTPENFKKNLETMCEKIEALGATPILLTSSYLDESKFYSVQGQSAADYADVGGPLAWLDTYNAMTKEVAEEGGYHLVDIRAACDEYTPAEFLTEDGIHLGDIGNQVYAAKISEYLLATFVSDPAAEKITTWFPYVASPAEPATLDIISYDPANWDSPVPSEMTFGSDNGALLIANTNGKWPEAHYAADTSVLVPMEGTELVYDISTANVNASILLFFDGATPFAPTEGKWVVINKKLGNFDPGSGDLLANQNLKGSIKLTELGIPETALDANGNLLISGVKIFAAGAANQNVTVRQLAVSTQGAPVGVSSELAKDQTYRVLMVGNSYTYYNELWDLFANVSAGAGYTFEVDHVTEGGYYLDQHANVSNTFGKQVNDKLTTVSYDFVVLQEQSTAPFKEYARFEAAVKDLAARIDANGAECVLYQTWGREPGSPALNSLGMTNKSMTEALVQGYASAAATVGATVSPVGEAFYEVVTNHTAIDLYDPDTTHPSLEGSYLAALCHFATMTGADPRTTTFESTLDADTAATLKQVAYDIVF